MERQRREVIVTTELLCDVCFLTGVQIPATTQLTGPYRGRTRRIDLCGNHLQQLSHVEPRKVTGFEEATAPPAQDGFTCPDCGRVFSRLNGLTRHQHESHPKSPESVKCSVCKRTFPSKRSLGQHMRNSHPEGA